MSLPYVHQLYFLLEILLLRLVYYKNGTKTTEMVCHCKYGSGEFGPGGQNLLVSHVGEFCPWDHIPWRILSVVSEFGPGDFPLAC